MATKFTYKMWSGWDVGSGIRPTRTNKKIIIFISEWKRTSWYMVPQICLISNLTNLFFLANFCCGERGMMKKEKKHPESLTAMKMLKPFTVSLIRIQIQLDPDLGENILILCSNYFELFSKLKFFSFFLSWVFIQIRISAESLKSRSKQSRTPPTQWNRRSRRWSSVKEFIKKLALVCVNINKKNNTGTSNLRNSEEGGWPQQRPEHQVGQTYKH